MQFSFFFSSVDLTFLSFLKLFSQQPWAVQCFESTGQRLAQPEERDVEHKCARSVAEAEPRAGTRRVRRGAGGRKHAAALAQCASVG